MDGAASGGKKAGDGGSSRQPEGSADDAGEKGDEEGDDDGDDGAPGDKPERQVGAPHSFVWRMRTPSVWTYKNKARVGSGPQRRRRSPSHLLFFLANFSVRKSPNSMIINLAIVTLPELPHTKVSEARSEGLR